MKNDSLNLINTSILFMNIGFDAKRAFQNNTGLGQYSRTLIHSLATHFSENEYYLFAPKLTKLFDTTSLKNVHLVNPSGFPSSLFKSAWRSNWMKSDLKKNNIHIYHGLSHEIPFGIGKTGTKSVVTIHDLIHERYPDQYKWLDVKIYHKKFLYACKHADAVIAISEQTKKDIIEIYGIPEEKINVCYQSCNPAFAEQISESYKQKVKELYALPDEFFLYVGTIRERKNLIGVCKALQLMKNGSSIPLVVIGDGTLYKKKAKEYIRQNGLTDQVILLSENNKLKSLPSFYKGTDFPAIFQQAVCLVLPSLYEGFGIPVLEAMNSRLPVITSNVSSLPEAGGNAAYYIDPNNVEQLAEAMLRVRQDSLLRKTMIEKGIQQAQKFLPQKSAESVFNVYRKLMG